MHFASTALASLSILGTVHAAYSGNYVTVYSDTECKHQVEVVQFSSENTYQCKEFQNQNAQAVIFHGDYNNLGYNVWDSDYCAGNRAGGLLQYVNHCLATGTYGVLSWKSAHVSPRNAN